MLLSCLRLPAVSFFSLSFWEGQCGKTQERDNRRDLLLRRPRASPESPDQGRRRKDRHAVFFGFFSSKKDGDVRSFSFPFFFTFLFTTSCVLFVSNKKKKKRKEKERKGKRAPGKRRQMQKPKPEKENNKNLTFCFLFSFSLVFSSVTFASRSFFPLVFSGQGHFKLEI